MAPHSLVRLRRALIVCDDMLRWEVARYRLAAHGLVAHRAAGSHDAVDAASRQRPDVIISDVELEDMDGFSLSGILRADPRLGSVPIVLAVPSSPAAAERDLARACGATVLVGCSMGFDVEAKAAVEALAAKPGPVAAGFDAYTGRLIQQVGTLLCASRRAEARYRTLFESAKDAIALLTPDGALLDVNHRWEQLLGLPREAIVGRDFTDFVPDTWQNPVGEFKACVAAPPGPTGPLPVVRADGTLFQMEFSANRVAFGGKDIVLSIGRDVTDHVEAVRGLSASEERFRLLVENLPDVVWAADPSGKFLFVSPRVASVCGFTAEELTGAPASFWRDRIHPDDRGGEFTGARDVSGECEYRWQAKDGSWVWLRSTAHQRLDSDGTRRVEGLFTDITKRKNLEEQVRQSQKMEAVGLLTGGIAHDFNNILAVVLGNADLVIESLPPEDIRREAMVETVAAAQKGAALTRQLLTFSRRQVIQPKPVDLNTVIRDVEKLLRRVLGEDVTLTIDLEEGLPAVLVDLSQMEQVLLNLAVNARDAMPEGGRLRIETTQTRLSPEQASDAMLKPGQYLMVRVTDSGCGMDAATRARVFEPFFTTKAAGKGTGLGLPTCHGIVKQSGGAISVYSEPGQGAMFVVLLPPIDEAAAIDTVRPALSGCSNASADGHEAILIIEDDPAMRSILRRTLQRRGYRLLEACDGTEALAVARSHPGQIDLIVSDVVMPGTNGPAVVAQLLKEKGPARVLFMSGYSQHAALRAGLAPEASFIQKPFDPKSIARKVRDLLDTSMVAS